MTTSQPISPDQKLSFEIGNPVLISSSHGKHPELWWGDLSRVRVNDGEEHASSRGMRPSQFEIVCLGGRRFPKA